MAANEAFHQLLASAGAEFEPADGYQLAAHFGDWHAEYASLTETAAIIDVGHRSRIGLTGEDRLSFLQSMCTNEIRKLPVDGGCEAFLANAQGRTLAHILVFCESDQLVLDTVVGQAGPIIAHLDRYIIRERVELVDLTESRAELLLGGPRASALLSQLCDGPLPGEYLSHATERLAGLAVTVRRVELVGPNSFLLDCPSEQAVPLWQALVTAGATPCGERAADVARIEAGFPAYGRDITEKNLPQEVGRDDRTISFVKGCYIGQETVARLDALGHVNRLLVRLRFAGREVPQAGAELTVDDKAAGQVTSAAYSPRLETAIALAYVRTGHEREGSLLHSNVGDATVLSPAATE